MRAFLIGFLWLAVFTVPSAADHAEPLTGQMLVADPGMTDPRFAEAVVFIVNHGDEGAIGIVVNRPMGRLPLHQLIEGQPGDVTIHYGGPVQPSLVMVLHDAALADEKSIVVNDKLAVTADQAEILRDRTGAPSLLTLGYAGWAPGQLEAELAAGFWAVAPAANDILFGGDNGGKWQRARGRIPLEL